MSLAAPTTAERAESRARARETFRLLRRTDSTYERAVLREQLVTDHAWLARSVAWQFRGRGEPPDDLLQVATVGLIKSVDRFDPDRGVDFPAYALPTMTGEVKRYFRDLGWAVRVPRALQERRLALRSATTELSQRLDRAPTVAELAGYLRLSEEEVIEGLAASAGYQAMSLDAPLPGDDSGDEAGSWLGLMGDEDPGIAEVEARESLTPLLNALPERERSIIAMRFYGGMTQTQIAARVGISQMHVSRLISQTLARLRSALEEG
ncbi:SigB/SigF/SigG family RNA polymerase sigma factor [Vallicoccus soli]|uniref:SigB/SigF/SigG family RNA polymerase sigma factor n=1 Tax=Vallicoccus soli TaxID=2339232 RepID=A0A3A3Z6K5_9ACTN|nr:SigB/SigF/SigG family RNA polymerase sigma factor [Vallicoccus soli]RJK97557.1 SigB/SigF/SigG family RNA polymerase sigma factor [Vallicoccus soli]